MRCAYCDSPVYRHIPFYERRPTCPLPRAFFPKVFFGAVLQRVSVRRRLERGGQRPFGGRLHHLQAQGGREGLQGQHGITSEQIAAAEASDDERMYPKRHGIDFYHHYKEDIALFKEMGSRRSACPSVDPVCSPRAPRRSRSRQASISTAIVLKTLKEADIEPLVTLHHYEMPLYLANHYDGWYKREVIDFFLRFCKVCFEEFGEYVHYWLTFNEIDSVFRHPGQRLVSARTAILRTSARRSSTSACTINLWRALLPPRCCTRWFRVPSWAAW